jgi:two-component system OmpR family response regulator
MMAELLARVRSLIRRSNGISHAVLVSGEIEFDTRSGAVTCAGKPIVLTKFEQRLLRFLMHRAGIVVSRTEMIEHIYAQDFDRDSNTLEVFIRRLRVKLGADAIETVRGNGYRMRPAHAAVSVDSHGLWRSV